MMCILGPNYYYMLSYNIYTGTNKFFICDLLSSKCIQKSQFSLFSKNILFSFYFIKYLQYTYILYMNI